MKLIKPVFFYILLAELIPRVCYSQNINIYEMQGKWEVVMVTENDKDITTSIDNNAQRWIEFVSDDRYNSDGYPFGRYEGEYHLDEDSGFLKKTF
jgi:hypothetical protein